MNWVSWSGRTRRRCSSAVRLAVEGRRRLGRLLSERDETELSRTRFRSEVGDTLIEVLIALVVIGLTGAGILGAFMTTISASAEQRSLSGADAFLRSFVETATYDISLGSSPLFVGCPTGVPSSYSNIASSSSTSTYTVKIASLVNEGTCPATQAPPQLLTATVSSSQGASDSMSFVVSQPNASVATISTAVTSISPTFGPAAGGTTVTVAGKGFTGATAVKFGTTPATSFHVQSDTTITVVSPAGTGSVDVTVTTPAGTSATNPLDTFTYAPTVTGISPTSGPTTGGTSVTITGTGFIGTGTTTVMFGSNPGTSVNVVTPSSLTVDAPAGSLGTVDVTVTTFAGTSVTNSADRYTYRISVTAISPSSGPDSGGTGVGILGGGFTGATAVTFGTTPASAFTVNSDSSITATAPAGTGTVDVTVTGPSGTSATSLSDRFTYTAGPPVGLGLIIKVGTGTPVANCAPGTGTTCSAPNSTTCIMTGSSTSTTCSISGVWQNANSASVAFYVETVDAAGNPVVYSTTTPLNLSVTSATPPTISIPANGTSTNPNTVTATLTSHNGVTNVNIAGGGYTLKVKVSA
jgi:type II secretory pathway pseudopilin PulG